VFSSPSPTSCGLSTTEHSLLMLKNAPHVICVTVKRAPSGIYLGVTWRSLLMILLTSAFACVVWLPIALTNSACASVRNVGWFTAAFIGWCNMSLGVGPPPAVTCCLTMLIQSCCTVFSFNCLATFSVPVSRWCLSKHSKNVNRYAIDFHVLPPERSSSELLSPCVPLFWIRTIFLTLGW